MKKITHSGVDLSNPALIYTTVWLLALMLANLRLTFNLLPFNTSSLILILGNIVTAWWVYGVLTTTFSNQSHNKQVLIGSVEKLKKFTNKLLVIWGCGSIFEIIYGNGFPLLWYFQKRAYLNYTDFGIPTFHGLMNSLFFFIVTAHFLDFIVTGRRKGLWVSLIMINWPILMLGRGILLGAVFQILGIYVILRRVPVSKLIQLTGIGLVMIILFGVIGDIRGTNNPFAYLIVPSNLFFEQLPSGFLWLYVYVTAPLANVIANVERIYPTYIPYYSTANFIPTFFRQIIWPEYSEHSSLWLVDTNLNVSTIYEGFLADFGVIGSIIAVTFLQIISTIIYLQSKKKDVWAIMSYAVIFQCLVFSIFYNLFFVQTYVFQIILALYFRKTSIKGQ